MDFSHYSCQPVELAAALVNTDHKAIGGVDAIADFAGFEAFFAGYRQLWDQDSEPPVEAALPAIHKLRARLRSVFEAETPEAAAEEINRLLAENAATPRVSTHGGGPHLHFEPSGTKFVKWLAVTSAMGLATVLVDQGVDRFGVCAAETCRDVFIDTSRNRSRRHCSTTCSTRENVAAFRRRRRVGV
jgi:predicted RNA-binding Zn ribbon-like protein